MSNIVVLQTKGPEYRVAQVTYTDDFYNGLDQNNKWIPNRARLHEVFDHSPIIIDPEFVPYWVKGLDSQIDTFQTIDIWKEIEYNNL